jgi:hypothetical protein
MENNEIKLLFPIESENHKYNLIHFRFFIQYAKHAGITVELVESDDLVFISNDQLTFSCLVNDKQIIIDYADHSTRSWRHLYPNIPYFKFQTNFPLPDKTIPLGPPIVGVKRIGTKGSTLKEYNDLRKEYKYVPGSTIVCKQLPNGAAVERRKTVHTLLIEEFGDRVDINAQVDQLDFWKTHENCLVSVCVPGATNNMVDRGHMELIGLGVCTISPKLNTVFPKNSLLVPDYHYIRCADDYSDLIDIIKKLEKTPALCKRIGNNARLFYDKYYSPKKYWEWILRNINE